MAICTPKPALGLSTHMPPPQTTSFSHPLDSYNQFEQQPLVHSTSSDTWFQNIESRFMDVWKTRRTNIPRLSDLLPSYLNVHLVKLLGESEAQVRDCYIDSVFWRMWRGFLFVCFLVVLDTILLVDLGLATAMSCSMTFSFLLVLYGAPNIIGHAVISYFNSIFLICFRLYQVDNQVILLRERFIQSSGLSPNLFEELLTAKQLAELEFFLWDTVLKSITVLMVIIAVLLRQSAKKTHVITTLYDLTRDTKVNHPVVWGRYGAVDHQSLSSRAPPSYTTIAEFF